MLLRRKIMPLLKDLLVKLSGVEERLVYLRGCL